MKTILFTILILAAIAGHAVTVAPIGPEKPQTPTPVTIQNTPVPVTLSDDIYETVFTQGIGLGIFVGGMAFIFRLVRQVGRQNPEI